MDKQTIDLSDVDFAGDLTITEFKIMMQEAMRKPLMLAVKKAMQQEDEPQMGLMQQALSALHATPQKRQN